MAWSKSSRIITLLAIDSVFFLLELVTGYAVHSLALVADSFHMLNDVLSLCVGLWAVKMANRTSTPKMYTYGYQRAETLGALVNGVFLVALCVTIFLEAIQRFVEPQEVSQPMLVLIVGCLGLLSNIVGLFLFHEHSHGPGGHDHSHGDATQAAEEGMAGPQTHDHHATPKPPHPNADLSNASQGANVETNGTTRGGVESLATRTTSSGQPRRQHSRSISRSVDYPGPREFRHNIVEQASRISGREIEDENDDEIAIREDSHEHDSHPADSHHNQRSTEPLLRKARHSNYETIGPKPADHQRHQHEQSKAAQSGGGGHSHGDLNMRGIFLHVMGDALGNIGVIVTALIIWLTDVPWRFYFDPAISLIITIIILCSAIPLCKAASRILLQAVPQGIEIEDVESDIDSLPGVVKCHDLHVWQLTDTKLIASLHVVVNFDFHQGQGAERYMALAEDIRECLHGYGIHSCTIQQEFEAQRARTDRQCLLDCGEACGKDKGCCPPGQNDNEEHDSHDGHDHSH